MQLSVKFTAMMEQQLDKVEAGKIEWQTAIAEFYGPFDEALSAAKQTLRKIAVPVLENAGTCEKCGKPLLIKLGRFGRFIGCSGYPQCRNTRAVDKNLKKGQRES